MSKYENGGPAYPVPNDACCNGISFRQWLIGQAMRGLMNIGPHENNFLGVPEGKNIYDWVASESYKYADAVIQFEKNES